MISPLAQVAQQLTAEGRAISLGGQRLTIDHLIEFASTLLIRRTKTVEFGLSRMVDVFAEDRTTDRLIERAWEWSRNRVTAPVRGSGILPATVLETTGLSLGFIGQPFGWQPDNEVYLISVIDLHTSGRVTIAFNPMNHLIVRDFV